MLLIIFGMILARSKTSSKQEDNFINFEIGNNDDEHGEPESNNKVVFCIVCAVAIILLIIILVLGYWIKKVKNNANSPCLSD